MHVRARLAPFLAMPEADLLAFVHAATPERLRRLMQLGLVCDCDPDFVVCPHEADSLLPVAVQAAVLERLFPDEYAEPVSIAPPTAALSETALARVRAERFAGGFRLWNPADLRHASPDFLGMLVSRGRNGQLRKRIKPLARGEVIQADLAERQSAEERADAWARSRRGHPC